MRFTQPSTTSDSFRANLQARGFGGSARKLTSVARTVANEVRGGIRELLDPPRTAPATGDNAITSSAARVTPAVPKLGDRNQPAQVYGQLSCPWTGRVVALLEREQAQFLFIDLDTPENSMLRSWLVAETKQNSNPYVFLRGRFIGGYNALDELARLGQLAYEMMSLEERARQPSRIHIEVARRDDNDRPPPGEA